MRHTANGRYPSARGPRRAVALGFVIAACSSAAAGVPKTVEKALRGQIIITQKEPLSFAETPGEEVSSLVKKLRREKIRHEVVDGVPTWTFYYTAFFRRRPKVTQISFDFYSNDKQRAYVANKRLVGIDPNLTVLTGSLSVSEDDGLAKGRKYLLQVVAEIRGREVTLASTSVATE